MKTTFKEIEYMKKNEFMNIIRGRIENKSLMDLNSMKENHSKVKHLEHPVLKMQNYIMPNENNIKRKDVQLIFSLRCRTTDVKMNMKSQHETYECRACGNENESQKHVIQDCKILNDKNDKTINYEKLFSDNVKDQVQICEKFKQNMQNLKEVIK